MLSKRTMTHLIVPAVAIWATTSCNIRGSSPPTTDLVFKGSASGGELLLAYTLNRNSRYIPIRTFPGESAASVAAQLADVVNAFHDDPNTPQQCKLRVGGFEAQASGSSLRLPGGQGYYILAGTEMGLGIPPPPPICKLLL